MNKKKYSPLKQRGFRNPGQSLDEHIQDRLFDVLSDATLIIFFIVLVALNWLEYFFHSPTSPWIITVLLIPSSLFFVWRIYQALNEIQKYKLGRDGERQVGHFLEQQFSPLGYRVVHDVRNEKGNIDHVLVGPGGIFTIETKTRSKNESNDRIGSDGKRIFVGDVVDINAINQASAEAMWLKNFIQRAVGFNREVQPIVVFPGWFVIMRTDIDVWVLNENYLVENIKNKGRVLDKIEITKIVDAIERHVRDFKN